MRGEHREEEEQSPARQRRREFLRARQQAWEQGTPEFERIERELPAPGMTRAREGVAAELARYDVTAERIAVGGGSYQPVVQAAETSLSAAGPIRVERHLSRPAGRTAQSLGPVEWRAGISPGYWTPAAARHGAVVVAQLPGSTAAARFPELGARPPSRSRLDRLPRTLSEPWEAQRADWEAARQRHETVPGEAIPRAIAVDGVRAPLKPPPAEREARAAKRTAPGKQASGPTGSREVGGGPLTRYDRAGDRWPTGQSARLPESKKGTLAAQLQAAAPAILGARPDLRRVDLADGAQAHWDWRAELERSRGGDPRTHVQIVDCSHAGEHLKGGGDASWGESTARSHAEFARRRVLLKEAADGAEQILRTLQYHCGRAPGPRRKRIGAALPYFRHQRGRLP